MTEHVKVYGVKPRIQYIANGTLKTFEFSFAIFKTSDIDVYFGDVLQDASIYTVSGIRHSEGAEPVFGRIPYFFAAIIPKKTFSSIFLHCPSSYSMELLASRLAMP